MRVQILRLLLKTAGMGLACGMLLAQPSMESLYDLRNAASLKPITYRIDTTITPHLFPVPQDNAIGTNDLDNAIKIFTFYKDRFLPKTHFRNAFSSVGGGGQYLSSPISDHTIGFAQTRRFVIYDFKEDTFKRYGICSAMDDSILHVDIADAAAKRFFFEIEEQNPESEEVVYKSVCKSVLRGC